jgi:hypothetical protein
VWAQRVSAGAIRARGDREIRQSLHDVREIERPRYLRWWHEDGGRTLCLEGRMPVAAGAVVMKALERISDQLPSLPEEEHRSGVDARRADALVALASARIASDPDPDRATVVVHVPWEVLTGPSGRGDGGEDARGDDEPGCGLEGGDVIHPETARRLAVRPGSKRWWKTLPAASSIWGGPHGSPRRRCSGRCAAGTTGAGSPGAERAGSPTPTTSGGGQAGDGPISTTW